MQNDYVMFDSGQVFVAENQIPRDRSLSWFLFYMNGRIGPNTFKTLNEN